MPLTITSSGSVTSLTASSAFRPGAMTTISTIGTEICGSSSRGKAPSATSPAASAARMKSGVSDEAIKALVRRPAMPKGPDLNLLIAILRGSRCMRHHAIPGHKTSQNLDHRHAINLLRLAGNHGAHPCACSPFNRHEIKPAAGYNCRCRNHQALVRTDGQAHQNAGVDELV